MPLCYYLITGYQKDALRFLEDISGERVWALRASPPLFAGHILNLGFHRFPTILYIELSSETLDWFRVIFRKFRG